MYEFVWFHILRLVIGSSSISIVALLVSFMGGIGLGSVALPRLVPRSWHPLKVYAGLELSIGVIGLILLVALPRVQAVYLAAVGYGLGGVLLRAIVCIACLLPPTMLMGATLPAVARWTGATRTGVAQTGLLYAANTIGAVVGVLIAGFYLLRLHDTVVTTLVAVGLNVGVALVALWLAARRHRATVSEVAEPRVAARPVVLAAIGLSGLASLGAEVVWTRQLSLLFGATVYNFSLILAVFLAGVGAGSLGGAWLAKRADLALGWCQLALLVALPYGAYMIGYQIPFWQVGEHVLPWVYASRPLLFVYDIARCAVSMGPATLCWGASFPLALAAANAGESDAGRLVTRVSVVNTLGALVGTVVFSLVVIPGLGTADAQQALAVVAATAAVVVFLAASRRGLESREHREHRPGAALERLRGVRLRPAWWAGLVVVATLASVWAVPHTPNGLIALGRDIEGWDTSTSLESRAFWGESRPAWIGVSGAPSGSHLLGPVRARRQKTHTRPVSGCTTSRSDAIQSSGPPVPRRPSNRRRRSGSQSIPVDTGSRA